MKPNNINALRRKGFALLLASITVTILTSAGAEGAYNISQYTIDGGGGQSSGGQYSLTGTIGQPDTEYSAGGNYELLGGFWPGGPLCIVDFEDFARFAELWLETGTGLAADLYEDNIVNLLDLKLFVDEWLCTCPYNWPLR
jgi:hypothetical protein